MPKPTAFQIECANRAIANFAGCAVKANYDAAVEAIRKCGYTRKAAVAFLCARVKFAKTFSN
jgi:hypothetical protein